MLGYTQQGSHQLVYSQPLDMKHIRIMACESFIAAIECKLMFSIIERAYQVYSIQDVYTSRVDCSGGVVKCVKWITENCVPIAKETAELEESWSSGNREGLQQLGRARKKSSRSCEDLLIKKSHRARMPDLQRGDSADNDYRSTRHRRTRSRERSPLSKSRTEWAEHALAPLIHNSEIVEPPTRPARKSHTDGHKKASRDSGYNSKPVSREMNDVTPSLPGEDQSIMPDQLYGHQNHKEPGTLSDFADALKSVTQGDDFDMYAARTLDDHLQRSLVAVEKMDKSPKKEKPKPPPKGDEWGHVRETLRREYGDEYFEGERGDILKNRKSAPVSSSMDSRPAVVTVEPKAPTRSKALARRTLGDPKQMELKRAEKVNAKNAAVNAKNVHGNAKIASMKKKVTQTTSGSDDSEVVPPVPPKGEDIRQNGSSFDSIDSGTGIIDPPVAPLRKSRVLRCKKGVRECPFPGSKEDTSISSVTSSQANTPATPASTPSPRNSVYLSAESQIKLDPPKIEGVVLMKSRSRGSSPTYDPRSGSSANTFPDPRVGANGSVFPDPRVANIGNSYHDPRIMANGQTYHEPKVGGGSMYESREGNRVKDNGPVTGGSLPPPAIPESAKIEPGIIRRPVRIPQSSQHSALAAASGLVPSVPASSSSAMTHVTHASVSHAAIPHGQMLVASPAHPPQAVVQHCPLHGTIIHSAMAVPASAISQALESQTVVHTCSHGHPINPAHHNPPMTHVHSHHPTMIYNQPVYSAIPMTSAVTSRPGMTSAAISRPGMTLAATSRPGMTSAATSRPGMTSVDMTLTSGPPRRSYYENLSDSDEECVGHGLQSPRSPNSHSSPANAFVENCNGSGTSNTIIRAGKSTVILEDQFKSILLAKDKRSSFHYGEEPPTFTSFGRGEEEQQAEAEAEALAAAALARTNQLSGKRPLSGFGSSGDGKVDWPDIIEERMSQISPTEPNEENVSPGSNTTPQESPIKTLSDHVIEGDTDTMSMTEIIAPLADTDEVNSTPPPEDEYEELPPPPPEVSLIDLSTPVSEAVDFPPPTSETDWQCESCTFANKVEISVCAVCGISRQVAPSSTGPQCPQCTYVNEVGSTNCIMCTTKLEVSPSYV